MVTNVPNVPLLQATPDGRLYYKGLERPMKENASTGRIEMYISDFERSYDVADCVASALVPNPEGGYHVTFKDGDKSNTAMSNLEWLPRNVVDLRPIGVFNADDDLVATFDTVEMFNGPTKIEGTSFTKSGIHAVLIGKQKTHHKHTFKYVD